MSYKAKKELKFYPRRHRDSDGCLGPNFEMGFIEGIDGLIWLPKQDQLQEIVGDFIANELEYDECDIKMAFISFKRWLDMQYYDEPYTCVPTNVFDSGEQLWLAFTMQEIYNKIWNGEEWIDEKQKN